jgi:hypothetical protein
MLKRCIEQRCGWRNVAIRRLHRDGAIHSFESSASPIIDAGGHITGFRGIDRDITERKLTEDTLLKVNQKLNVLSQMTRKDLTNHLFILNSYL